MNKNTPLPWVLVPQGDGSSMLAREFETGKQMNPKGFRLIAHILVRGNSLPENEANAAFIKRAVNAHEELVGLLYVCQGFTQGLALDKHEGAQILHKAITQAIAKAEAA